MQSSEWSSNPGEQWWCDTNSNRSSALLTGGNPFTQALPLHRGWENDSSKVSSSFTVYHKDGQSSAFIEKTQVSDALKRAMSTSSSSMYSRDLVVNSEPFYPFSVSTLESPKISDLEVYTDKKSFKRLKIIEELIDSEMIYLDSLRILCYCYIESFLDTYKTEAGIPINMIHNYIVMLIEKHSNFLNQLTETYYYHWELRSLGLDFDTERPSTLDIAKEVSQIIVQYSISPYLYEQYCLLNSQILKLMAKTDLTKSQLDDIDTVRVGSEMFTEAVQTRNQHMDLSFISLFQKPIVRISKYKIMLESLSVLNNETDQEGASEIAKNLATIQNKLNDINDNVKDQQFKLDSYNALFQALNASICNYSIIQDYYKNDESLVSSFNFESFGYPLLVGALAVIYMDEDELIITKHYCCVQFKSHLLLIQSKHYSNNRFDIKFMIPLVCCKISRDVEGLTVTNFIDFTFKIIFEKSYQLFELVFICLNKTECDCWVNELTILTEIVNGPYLFNYSFSEESHLMYVPERIRPLDVCLERLITKKWGHYQNTFNNCYFRELILLRISHYEPSETGYQVEDQKSVVLHKKERIEVEQKFKSFLSEEFPLLSSRKCSTFTRSTMHNSKSERRQSTHESLKSNGSLVRRASIAFSDYFGRQEKVK